ncbi:MAG: hypothetical protein OXG96_17550 [Acidobacteria bacterium]|nr:hypothetical protein [Acidobacteriota bacterium]
MNTNKNEPFAKHAAGQITVPATVRSCLFRYRVRPVSHAGSPQKAQESQIEFLEPVEGCLADVITQGPHALVVSHRSALFVFLCLLWPFVFIRVHSWFAFIDDRLFSSNELPGRARAGLPVTGMG